eukprot:9374747-Pyramimonas_sp.AAC.1
MVPRRFRTTYLASHRLHHVDCDTDIPHFLSAGRERAFSGLELGEPRKARIGETEHRQAGPQATGRRG